MEILQTIWNALTTENEFLIKIINIPLVFIEMTVSVLLFTTILNIDSTKKQKTLYVILLSILGLFTSWFISVPYNTFINIIACPICVYFIFKTNILKSVLAEVVQYVAFILSLSFLVNVYSIIFNVNSNAFIIIPIHKLCYSLIQYLFIYLLYAFCKNIEFNINIKDSFKKKNNVILLINFIIGIISLVIQSYITTKYMDILPYSLQFSTIFILLVCFIISMFSLYRTNKLEVTTENLEEEKLYNKTLTILYDNIRGFKHDFNNIVQSIGGYISTNDMNGLKNYYSDLMTDCQKVNNLAILNPELINNPAIYSLLTSKYHKAEELNIKINFEVFLDLKTLNIKTYNLTRILGILLDNAIEASNKCDEKIIYITIRKDNKANRQLFVIENTYSNKSVDTERIFEKGYTSKNEADGKNHGLGLWEVRQILKKSNNLNLFTTKTNKLFKQQLEIYY
ncbi:MAG: GHKL domain-containing protein [Clostridia bacterium]|nr:GHKL domain-containing protein [Clostridia bacterium]